MKKNFVLKIVICIFFIVDIICLFGISVKPFYYELLIHNKIVVIVIAFLWFMVFKYIKYLNIDGVFSIFEQEISIEEPVSCFDGFKYKYKGSTNNHKDYRIRENFKYDNNSNMKDNRTEEISNKLRQNDLNFSDEKFIAFVEKIFSKIAQDLSNNELVQIKVFTTQELFSKYENIVNENISKNQTRIIEKIIYPYCELVEYNIESNQEVLQVELHTINRDYVKQKSGRIVEGMPYKDFNDKYLLTFVRNNNTKTKEEELVETMKCPNCGANTEINYIGQCSYCHNIIILGQYNWKLSNIERMYRNHYFLLK